MPSAVRLNATAEPTLKLCGKCKAPKPMDAFARHSGTRDGRQSACKDCFRTHYNPLAVRKPRPPVEAPMAQVLSVMAALAAKGTPEAVAKQQILAESATCARGHARVRGNVYVRPSGRSECRPCGRHPRQEISQ